MEVGVGSKPLGQGLPASTSTPRSKLAGCGTQTASGSQSGSAQSILPSQSSSTPLKQSSGWGVQGPEPTVDVAPAPPAPAPPVPKVRSTLEQETPRHTRPTI